MPNNLLQMPLKLLKSNSKNCGSNRIGNKVAGAVAKSFDDKKQVPRTLPQNTSETEDIGLMTECQKNDLCPHKKRQRITDELRLIKIYEYKGISKIIHLLDNKVTQTSTFRTKKWVEITEGECGTNNINTQIKFKAKDCSRPGPYISFKYGRHNHLCCPIM